MSNLKLLAMRNERVLEEHTKELQVGWDGVFQKSYCCHLTIVIKIVEFAWSCERLRADV